MDRFTRVLVYGALALVLAFVAVTIAFFVVNTGDEALSPEAAKMLERPSNPYKAAENLRVALAGFDAPKGASPIAAGEKVLAEYERIAQLPSRERKAAFDKFDDERERLQVDGSFDCRPALQSCWTEVEARRSQHLRHRDANPELYRRYLDLHAMRGYFEPAPPSLYLPATFIPGPLRSVFVEDVALRLKDAKTGEERSAVLADLDRDIRTWRAMLAGEGTLVSKFVAMYNLHGDYALLADILGDPAIDVSPHLAEMEAMLARVAPGDWKVTGALDYEFRMLAQMYDELDREQGLLPARAPGEKAPWWQSLVPGDASAYFQPNATKNLAALHMVEVKRLADAEGAAFTAEREKLRRWREQHLTPGLAYFHNPMGRVLVGVAPDRYDEYPLRAHDIAGFHRLVRLAFEVRKENVGDDAIPAFIKARAWASHPVSAEPFAWDAAKRQLVMTPLAAVNKERRFRIPVR